VAKPSHSLLDPIDRLSEILFGLIMALTFTGSLSVAQAGREDVRTMLAGALGCNVAWGIIDAILFLMGTLAERSQSLKALKAVRTSSDPAMGRRFIADALPPVVAAVMTDDELDSIRRRLMASGSVPDQARLDGRALLDAVGIFLLVVVTTFPVVIPFLISDDALRALRLSNAIAMVMLFVTGYLFARLTGRRPWVVGALMILLGGALVGITIALGG
jgi:VIT1/CCC1 family predicted Fe2+/Mn2+ transporter